MPQTQQIIGIIAGICTGTSMLPQLIKILKKKKADDISYLMLIVLLAGLAGWVWYGCLQSDIPIIITNAFSFLINVCILILAMIYKTRS